MDTPHFSTGQQTYKRINEEWRRPAGLARKCVPGRSQDQGGAGAAQEAALRPNCPVERGVAGLVRGQE